MRVGGHEELIGDDVGDAVREMPLVRWKAVMNKPEQYGKKMGGAGKRFLAIYARMKLGPLSVQSAEANMYLRVLLPGSELDVVCLLRSSWIISSSSSLQTVPARRSGAWSMTKDTARTSHAGEQKPVTANASHHGNFLTFLIYGCRCSFAVPEG